MGFSFFPISKDTILTLRSGRTGNTHFISEFIFPKDEEEILYFYNFGSDHGTLRKAFVDTSRSEYENKAFVFDGGPGETHLVTIVSGIGIVEQSQEGRVFGDGKISNYKLTRKLIEYELK